MRQYLLTGATGVIGSALLRRLVNSNEKVILLIRADSDRCLDRRIKELVCFCQLDDPAKARIHPVRADLYQPKLGLPGHVYQNIFKEVTHILHCAGNVNMGLPIHVAEKQTMTMTGNMLKLMEKNPQIRKMEYVSTIGVAGHTPHGIPEEWMNHERLFHNSYEAAKSCAETFIQKEIQQGKNITVHRPSMVVGDSRTGENIHFQVFYHLCEFLSGARTLGFIPSLRGVYLDLVPCDYVADLIYWASCQEKDLPRILHACSGPKKSIGLDELAKNVRRIYQKNGYRLPKSRRLPVAVYQAMVDVIKYFTSKKTKRALNTLPLFLSYVKTPQHFINTRTRKLAKAAGIELPPAKTYIEPMLEYYLGKTKKRPGS